jgi:hypothetical protein
MCSRKGHLQFFMKEYEKAAETYEAGLQHDPNNAELKEGITRCMQAIHKVSERHSKRFLNCTACVFVSAADADLLGVDAVPSIGVASPSHSLKDPPAGSWK